MKKRPKKPKNGKIMLSPRGEASPLLQPLRHGGPDPPSSRVFRAPPRLRALPLRTQPPKCLPRLDRGSPFLSEKQKRHREPRIGVKRSIFTSALAPPAPHAHMASAFGRRMFALRSGTRLRFTFALSTTKY